MGDQISLLHSKVENDVSPTGDSLKHLSRNCNTVDRSTKYAFQRRQMIGDGIKAGANQKRNEEEANKDAIMYIPLGLLKIYLFMGLKMRERGQTD